MSLGSGRPTTATTATTAVLALVVALATGCSSSATRPGGDEGRTALDAAEAAVSQVQPDVTSQLGEALEAPVTTGSAGWETCGDPAVTGASYDADLQLEPPAILPEDVADAVEQVLTDQGFDVRTSGGTDGADDTGGTGGTGLTGSRDGVEVSVVVGPYATELRLTSGCVDVAADLVEEYADREPADLG